MWSRKQNQPRIVRMSWFSSSSCMSSAFAQKPRRSQQRWTARLAPNKSKAWNRRVPEKSKKQSSVQRVGACLWLKMFDICSSFSKVLASPSLNERFHLVFVLQGVEPFWFVHAGESIHHFLVLGATGGWGHGGNDQHRHDEAHRHCKHLGLLGNTQRYQRSKSDSCHTRILREWFGPRKKQQT